MKAPPILTRHLAPSAPTPIRRPTLDMRLFVRKLKALRAGETFEHGPALNHYQRNAITITGYALGREFFSRKAPTGLVHIGRMAKGQP